MLKAEAQEAQAAVNRATAELKRLRSSTAASEQHAAVQIKELQGQLKAAEAATRWARAHTGLINRSTRYFSRELPGTLASLPQHDNKK